MSFDPTFSVNKFNKKASTNSEDGEPILFDSLPTWEPPKEFIGNKNPLVSLYGLHRDNKKCSDCAYLLRKSSGARTYSKCERRGVTNGKATDHSMRFEACGLFKSSEHQ